MLWWRLATLLRVTDPAVRHLTPADAPLLRIATLGNVNWDQERFSMSDVDERAEFAHYTHLDVARGDFGFATEKNGRPVGAAWAIFLPAEDAGYGFVNVRIPEVSLWIDAGQRGHGLGRLLLRRVKSEARSRGISHLSLSVDAGNFAKRLYESEGFRDVPGRERDGVMIWASQNH